MVAPQSVERSMKRVRVVVVAAVTAFAASSASAQDGAAIYAQRCASCHEGGQVARAPSREVMAALPPDRIVGALEPGAMRVQGESLTPEQRRAVAVYVSAARPTAATANAPA